jgi:hypothetical protein
MNEAFGGNMTAADDARRQPRAQRLHAPSDLELDLDVSRSFVLR